MIRGFINILAGGQHQSWIKVVGTVELDQASPIPPNQYLEMLHFSQQNEKNHFVFFEGEELAWCPNLFV